MHPTTHLAARIIVGAWLLLQIQSLIDQDDKRDGDRDRDEPEMMGMSHGPGGMSGGGMGSGVKAGGSFADFLMQSSYTQAMLNMVVGMFPDMKMTKKTLDLPSSSKRPGAKSADLWFGPFEIVDAATRKTTKNPNPIAMDPGGTSFTNKITSFPRDITLLDATVKLVYEDGSPASVANGIYNHHIAFQDTAKKPPAMAACPGKPAKLSVPISVFVASGEDGNSYNYAPRLPDFNSGYYIGPKDGIAVMAEIINYSNKTRKIFANVKYNYVPGKPKYDVSSVTLSVTQCEANANVGIKPEKGQKVFSMASKNMTIQMDGYIFAVRGHLHDGGDHVEMTVNGKSVCQSKAIYGGASGTAAGGNWTTVSDMSTCNDPIAVKKGDQLAISAKYDLQAHPARQHSAGGEAEEMGLAMFTFASTADAVKPTLSSNSGGIFSSIAKIPGTVITSVGNGLAAAFKPPSRSHGP